MLDPQQWQLTVKQHGLTQTTWDKQALQDPVVEETLLAKLSLKLNKFPGYARVRRVVSTLEPWTAENALLTSTLKTRRDEVAKFLQADIQRIYQGHE